MTQTRLAIRRRSAPTSRTVRKSIPLTIVSWILVIYALIPLIWLVVNSTKSTPDLFTSFGLWFSPNFNFFVNVGEVFSYDDGLFSVWLRNSFIYTVVGAGGATILAALGGYGLAKYRFPGRRAYLAVVLGAIAVPGTALAVPTFLLFSQVGLTNTPWAVLLPSLVSPFGLYLMWVYAIEAVPNELIDAARVDGAGEVRIFFSIAARLLAPGIVTVALFAIVATWNNYFLPLIMLTDTQWYPLPVGLTLWNSTAIPVPGQETIYNVVITAAFLTIIPIVIVFLLLQRYWQSGLAAGGVKE